MYALRCVLRRAAVARPARKLVVEEGTEAFGMSTCTDAPPPDNLCLFPVLRAELPHFNVGRLCLLDGSKFFSRM